MKSDLQKIKELGNSLISIEENLRNEISVLKSILDFSTDGFWQFNPQENKLYLSKKALVKLGLENYNTTFCDLLKLLDVKSSTLFKLEISELLLLNKDEFNISCKLNSSENYIVIHCKVLRRNNLNKPTLVGGSFNIFGE